MVVALLCFFNRQLGKVVMRVLPAVLVWGLLVLSIGCAAAQHHNHQEHMDQGASAADTREFVKFPPELVEHIITNMRDHLLALQQINEALASGELEIAGKIAEERLGMSSLRLHCGTEVARYMPQGMQYAGMEMHKAASRFAIEAQNVGVTGELKPALGALDEVMAACVGCHAGYRLK